MKRTLGIALFILIVFSMIGIASAQDRAAQATVPFSFSVGDRVLPAATYQVSSPSAGVMKIQSLDGTTEGALPVRKCPGEHSHFAAGKVR